MKKLLWLPIKDRLEAEDDPKLWQMAIEIIVSDLGCEMIWEDVPTPNRIHLVIARQSNWWRPHLNLPRMYGRSVGGLGTFEPPDWEEHWFRTKRDSEWEYRGSSAGKMKGKTSHCLTFFPARTKRHKKASVVQIWKPPISPGLPFTNAKKKKTDWYPDGKRYLFKKADNGKWERKA